MNKVEKIKAEIERLKKSLSWGSCASQISMECNCKNEAYNEVLSYIDSLEKEPISNDLKEAAIEAFKQIVDSNKNSFLEIFKAGAQWQKHITDKGMIKALHTEYEKGRADVIADTLSFLENCWPKYCSNQTIIEGFKEAMKE